MSEPPKALAASLRGRDRAALARAITLVESESPGHRRLAAALLDELVPVTGGAHRIGITGAPGVGKSSLIDRIGRGLIAAGRRVGVLAVDPSSTRSGGSILGDKTRMPELARSEAAFVRPSPSACHPGGVARKTRESLLLLEAAGYDAVLVETVGSGQGETAVADLVDCLVVLVQAGAGDELQGIKRGMMELADMVLVTKADGAGEEAAEEAARACRAALAVLHPDSGGRRVPVHAVSARTGRGCDELLADIDAHRRTAETSGAFAARRRRQEVAWMWRLVDDAWQRHLRAAGGDVDPEALAERVAAGELDPRRAAGEILSGLGM